MNNITACVVIGLAMLALFVMLTVVLPILWCANWCASKVKPS